VHFWRFSFQEQSQKKVRLTKNAAFNNFVVSKKNKKLQDWNSSRKFGQNSKESGILLSTLSVSIL